MIWSIAKKETILQYSNNIILIAMTYPIHYRKKILAKLEQGMTFQEAAAKFELSPTTIQRWKKRLEPKTTHDYKPRKIHDELILQDLKDYPNDYQFERAIRLGCSKSGIQKALKRLGINPKKNTKAPKINRKSYQE